jgi:hypothetical protein
MNTNGRLCLYCTALLAGCTGSSAPERAPAEQQASMTREFERAVVTSQVEPNGNIYSRVYDLEQRESIMEATWHKDQGLLEYVATDGTVADAIPITVTPTLEGANLAAYVVYTRAVLAGESPYDAPGCDSYADTVCTTACCADHDRCYEKYNCTSSSWTGDDHPHGQWCADQCDGCNSAAASCISAHGLIGCHDSWYGDDSCLDNPCGCDNDECYDDNTNTSYCRSDCLPEGQLPSGVSPGTGGVSRESDCY